MTERDEMLALADGLMFAANNTRGCLYSQRKMLNDAAAALRSAARTGQDVAGFEACRWATKKAIIEARDKFGSPVGDAYDNGVWDQSQHIYSAIAALPAPAGRSVGIDELEFAIRAGRDLTPPEAARNLLATFTITRKSEARS